MLKTLKNHIFSLFQNFIFQLAQAYLYLYFDAKKPVPAILVKKRCFNCKYVQSERLRSSGVQRCRRGIHQRLHSILFFKTAGHGSRQQICILSSKNCFFVQKTQNSFHTKPKKKVYPLSRFCLILFVTIFCICLSRNKNLYSDHAMASKRRQKNVT